VLGVTLILACLTAERIVVAADRRLTLPDGSLHDDDANKAVFYCGRCAVAYTGLAKIQGEDTSNWIARQFAEENQFDRAADDIAHKLEGVLGQHPAAYERIAILMFGWATQNGQPPLRPYCRLVSNFFDSHLGWLENPNRTVVTHVSFLDEHSRNQVVVAGQRLHPVDVVWLTRRTRSCAEHNTGPAPYAFFLAQMIRAVAEAGDERSKRGGRALIIQALSLHAIESGSGGLLLTPLTAVANSFLYVAEDGSVDRFQGPILACDGAVITGFGGRTIPPGGKSHFDSMTS
jgi:hypothetical protein